MGKLLVLYDTKDEDFARDIGDFLGEVGVEPEMIPLAADQGGTLEDKEAYYLGMADAALFVLTPGCERNSLLFPSPSVTHEMGQAKQLFKHAPKKLIYLLERGCQVPSIDQKSRIEYDPGSARSVTKGLRLLVKNLKAASILQPRNPAPTRAQIIEAL